MGEPNHLCIKSQLQFLALFADVSFNDAQHLAMTFVEVAQHPLMLCKSTLSHSISNALEASESSELPLVCPKEAESEATPGCACCCLALVSVGARASSSDGPLGCGAASWTGNRSRGWLNTADDNAAEAAGGSLGPADPPSSSRLSNLIVLDPGVVEARSRLCPNSDAMLGSASEEDG